VYFCFWNKIIGKMFKLLAGNYRFAQKSSVMNKMGMIRGFGGKNLDSIRNALAESYDARIIEVTDESASHREANDSHFRVYIASDVFEGLSHIKRHKKVKDLLKEKGIMDKIHALSMTTRTILELETSDPEKARKYPCLGGSKFDKDNKLPKE
jgi:BolA family transcriptional regulator, general stress-responsive regulator